MYKQTLVVSTLGISGHFALKIVTYKTDEIYMFYSLFVVEKLKNKL